MSQTLDDINDLLSERFIKSILEQDEPTAESRSFSQKEFSTNTPIKYKTQRCRYYAAKGSCPFGRTCAFAHENWEMREKNNHLNYKTKHCNNFSKFGVCKYGDRCQFKHQIRKVEKAKSHSTFWEQLDTLPSLFENDISSSESGNNYRRLKDSFEKINWVYKKPRMYTI